MSNWWEGVAQLGFAVFVALMLLKQMIFDKNRSSRKIDRSIQSVAITLITLQKQSLLKIGCDIKGQETAEELSRLAGRLESLHTILADQRTDLERLFDGE